MKSHILQWIQIFHTVFSNVDILLFSEVVTVIEVFCEFRPKYVNSLFFFPLSVDNVDRDLFLCTVFFLYSFLVF